MLPHPRTNVLDVLRFGIDDQAWPTKTLCLVDGEGSSAGRLARDQNQCAVAIPNIPRGPLGIIGAGRLLKRVDVGDSSIDGDPTLRTPSACRNAASRAASRAARSTPACPPVTICSSRTRSAVDSFSMGLGLPSEFFSSIISVGIGLQQYHLNAPIVRSHRSGS